MVEMVATPQAAPKTDLASLLGTISEANVDINRAQCAECRSLDVSGGGTALHRSDASISHFPFQFAIASLSNLTLRLNRPIGRICSASRFSTMVQNGPPSWRAINCATTSCFTRREGSGRPLALPGERGNQAGKTGRSYPDLKHNLRIAAGCFAAKRSFLRCACDHMPLHCLVRMPDCVLSLLGAFFHPDGGNLRLTKYPVRIQLEACP